MKYVVRNPTPSHTEEAMYHTHVYMPSARPESDSLAQYFEGTYFLKSLNPLPFSLWESYIINGCRVGFHTGCFLGGGDVECKT